MKNLICYLTILCLNISCNLFCGNLGDTHKQMLSEAQNSFAQYCSIEPIPCESYYLNVNLKQDIKLINLGKLHSILYDSKSKTGWMSLHIYNEDGVFQMTHLHYGNTSKKAPNW